MHIKKPNEDSTGPDSGSVMKRKLCIVTPLHWTAGMGGAEYQIKLLIEALAERGGYDVTYLARDVDMDVECQSHRSIRVSSPRAVNRFGYFYDIPGLYRELLRIQPDCIYQRVGCAYTGVAAHYARRSGCRLVWHVAHDGDVRKSKLPMTRNMAFQYLEKKCLEYGVRRIKTIVVQTEHQRELLQAHYGRCATAVIRNFHPEPTELIEKPDRPLNILWVANLKSIKQPEVFVRLARDLANVHDVHFTMLGMPFAKRDQQVQFVRDVGQITNLTYVGAMTQAEVNQHLALSHLLVNTSRMEGFSNTFIQAWMRQVPVVSLMVDPDGLIAAQRLGLVGDSYDSLVRNVRMLIGDAELREAMGRHARAYASKTYSMGNAEQLIDLL